MVQKSNVTLLLVLSVYIPNKRSCADSEEGLTFFLMHLGLNEKYVWFLLHTSKI